jgi:hypothetical protein
MTNTSPESGRDIVEEQYQEPRRNYPHLGMPINTGKTVSAVALSLDGHIAAGVDNDVCISDIETRQKMALMKGHTGSIVDSCLFTRWQSNRVGEHGRAHRRDNLLHLLN